MTEHQLGCTCGLREHIQKMIDKCTKEMETIENGNTSKLLTIPDELWNEMQEARYDYLGGLKGKLMFMLEYPEREQIV